MAFTVACNSNKGEKVDATTATEDAATVTASSVVYGIDPSTSIINWIGRKSFIPDQHNGTIKLSSGKLAVENGELKAGEFVIDMNSIVDEDLKKADANAKLVGHLKSKDFFAADTYPTAKFEIVNVEKVQNSTEYTHNITGNLTMRDSTKQIVIPANVAITEDKVTAVTPEFTIDRTQWSVMYGSDKEKSMVGAAKDKIISNDITLRLLLNGTKTM
ncbi:MAG: YceI family protein [Saprospiraceae bacterium]|nr:YceI family protein [Saprospiraceae bacterium]